LVGILSLVPCAATAALPEPVLNGVVVEDVSRPFSFDQIVLTNGETTVLGNAYHGNVRSKVIREADGTFDFYVLVAVDPGSVAVATFENLWRTPTSYTVAHHDFRLIEFGSNPDRQVAVAPLAGATAQGALGTQFTWRLVDPGVGASSALQEAVFVLDTDARRYAATAQYQLLDSSDKGGSLTTSWTGTSPAFTTFGPSPVPEPATWALMLGGFGMFGALGRYRHRQRLGSSAQRRA
jgi:hypothetical protein